MAQRVTVCPRCGAAMEQVEATAFDEYVEGGFHIVGRPLPRRPRETVVAACTGCEFVVDLRHPNGTAKSSAHLLREVGQWLVD